MSTTETTGTNGIDKVAFARWTKEVLAIHSRLADQKPDNMRICKEIREPLPSLYDAAENAGLPIKAFKAHIKAELAKMAYETRLKNIEPEDEDAAAFYAMMREIAEPDDLFDAAAKTHEAKAKAATKKKEKASKIDSLADTDNRADENAERLKSGIQQLN